MLKKALYLLLFTFLTPFIIRAEWIPLDSRKTAQTPPKITLVSDDQNSTIIRIELSGFDLKNISSGGKTFQAVDLLSESFTTDPGLPEIPYLAKVLAIPDQASVTVEVLETGKVSSFRDISLLPARESWYEGSPEPAYIENTDAYRSGKLYPVNPAEVEPPSIFRDFRIARVSVFPVRYKSGEKELQVASSMTVRITYGTEKTVNAKSTGKRAIAPSFGQIYRSSIFNYQEVLNREYGGREEGHDLMLCIMPDEFYTSFQVYADWKKQSGIDVHVTKFFEIGGNTNNPDVIKAYIANAYHTWDVPPTYVLIVGDDGVFPKKIVTYPDYSFPNEDYFVEIDGNDYFPEMMIGRFTNQGDYRMQVMINKFMLYEKTPNILSTAWFKKGTVCSNNMYESQKDTKRYAAFMMTQYGRFTSVDTLMSDGSGWGYDCTVDLEDVISAINEGRSFLNYRGEGWSDGWQASCYNFTTSDVSALNNGEHFTFVTSIGCGVAMFDTWGANNCFGEEWVEQGSLVAPKGGVAFVGPTSNTHTTYNNKIDKGIYTGMFTEGLETPGQALLRGKFYMYNVYGGDYYTEYHYKIYCILGDPSIHIWKDVPLLVNVEHPDSILVGPHQVEITVTFSTTGLPAPNAQVTLSGDNIFTTGYCDDQGKVYLNITPELPDTLIVTARGGNVFPYQGEIAVIQPAELVEPETDPLIVDLDGNLDGLVNPNENCSVTFTLKNWGYQTATNVMATLSSTDLENIEILTQDPISFGNLSSGAKYTGNPFQIFIDPYCPIGQIIPLHLHIVSDDGTWDYDYSFRVNGCELGFSGFLVNDAGSPVQNYRMDPGETVMLFVSIANAGNDIAPDVVGVLAGNDPYITISDSLGAYGTLNIDSTRFNIPNYYLVSVAQNCPVGHLAEFTLKLSTCNGNYPYRSNPVFTVPVSLPVATDYTGPDAYGYYAYSSDDYFDQSPDYNWYEIDGIGSAINMAGMGEYTETVNLPFAFKYYGIEYNQLRISTDGWIAMGSGTQTAAINTGLPHLDNINCMVAGFWDDLYDSETVEGNIYYYSDLVNHRFIVEWDSIARNDFGSEPNVEIFQVVLYDPEYYTTQTGDGEIVIYYKQVMAPSFCTVGIENHSQDVGLQYLFNDTYDPSASDIKSAFAIKFTTEPPYASIITGTDDNKPPVTANGYRLEQNNPNPFINETRISYTIPADCQVSLSIFDLNGKPVRTLTNGHQVAGSHSILWNGLDNTGNPASSGIYYYQLNTDNYQETRKMFILR